MRIIKTYVLSVILVGSSTLTQGQALLSLKEAMTLGQNNYKLLAAKQYQSEGAKSELLQAKRDYLPNLVFSAQHNYGTINGQNGPLFGFGGYGVASSGLPLPEQNWNSAFGALYLANINWEVFAFGKARDRNRVAETSAVVAASDLVQEQFQHDVRVAAAYLNLLATQRMVKAQEKNMIRAGIFRQTAVARAANGLIAGVDSSLANAEFSNAKIALIKARDFQQEEAKKFAILIGSVGNNYSVDSVYIMRIPTLPNDSTSTDYEHPVLSFYKNRVEQRNLYARFVKKSYYPTLTMFGVIQTRGSGFEYGYTADQSAYTHNYFKGITPARSNYLLGLGIVWNLTSLSRIQSQVKTAEYSYLSSQSEYDLARQQLIAQASIADQKFVLALEAYKEVPIQVKAAESAYQQKLALYKNGLTTIIDLTQTLYTLNRAETDRDIAFINVWQALLMKAAASGDLDIFKEQIQ